MKKDTVLTRGTPPTQKEIEDMSDEELLEYHYSHQADHIRESWESYGKPGALDTLTMMFLRKQYMAEATPVFLIPIPEKAY